MKKYTETLSMEIPLVSEPIAMYSYIQSHKMSHIHMQWLDSKYGLNDDIIASWLHITPKTYRSYKKTALNIKENIKEHVFMLLSLHNHGIAVFNSNDRFEQWLSSPNMLLNNKAPMHFLDTITGITFIDKRLSAIEYGENV